MTLQEVVARFNTTPFLFVGSGITRRYYNLPNWKDLLKHFAEEISKDRFAYRSYESRAEELETPNGLLPMVASLIQRDYETEWYRNPELRTLDEAGLAQVEAGASPFKAEVAAFIKANSILNPEYKPEIDKLKNISKQNIAGVITTNYDAFFDKLFPDYRVYIGQNDLVFSAIQGIAEIYKIHGSIMQPDSLVINNDDYRLFNEKSKYLAAKLMTIFMEYPIIFMGYSLADENIRNILSDITVCLPDDKFEKLQERFVFVERKRDMSGVTVSSHSVNLGNRMLNMTKVSLSDFGLLYDALAAKKAGIPVKLLRRFKEEIYSYVITSKPGPLMQVAPLDDPQIDEDRLAISIGTQTTGEYGLGALVDSSVWYRDIITDEVLTKYHFSYDQMLEVGFSSIFKGTSGYLPVHKALRLAENTYPEIETRAAKSFDDLATNTIFKWRASVHSYSSAKDLWAKEKLDFKRALRLLGCLPEEKMKVEELKEILEEIFTTNPDVLTNSAPNIPTDIKRLIRYYDFLRWGKKKDLQT